MWPYRQGLCFFFFFPCNFSDRLGSPAWLVLLVCVHKRQNYTVSSIYVFIHDHGLDKVKIKMGQTKDDWIVSLSYFEKKQFMFFLRSHYQPYSFWRILVWNLNVLASWEKFDIYLILSLGSEKKKLAALLNNMSAYLFLQSLPGLRALSKAPIDLYPVFKR